MSITIYHTEGIILSYNDSGEADRVFDIYTKDFGLLKIHAKGIRLAKSKLRYHTNLFSHSRIAFVQGKDVLRLTDAEEIKKFSNNSEKLKVFGNAANLIQRMIRGQEQDEKVWNLVLSTFDFLRLASPAPETVDILFGVRLLHRLGYVGELPDNLKIIIKTNSWEYVQLPLFADLQGIFEKGLEASHL